MIVEDSKIYKWPPIRDELTNIIYNHTFREVARLYGKSPATIIYWCQKLNIPPKSRYKYPRKPFNGDINEKVYLAGLSEDYNIFRRSFNTIRIQGGSTHPSFIQLTYEVFSKWGHIIETPCYNKRNKTYYMHLRVDVDKSFDFLLNYKNNRVRFLNEFVTDKNLYNFIAGLIDAEGSISINIDERNKREWVSVRIPNTSTELINWLHNRLEGYITVHSEGFNSGYKPVYIWGLNFKSAIRLLQKIDLRHPEKRMKKQIILENVNDLRRARKLFMEYNAFIEKEKQRFIEKIKYAYLEKKQ